MEDLGWNSVTSRYLQDMQQETFGDQGSMPNPRASTAVARNDDVGACRFGFSYYLHHTWLDENNEFNLLLVIVPDVVSPIVHFFSVKELVTTTCDG